MADQNFTTEELAAEEWRPVLGFESAYAISSLGRVRSERTRNNTSKGRILRAGKTRTGYVNVKLTVKCARRHKYIHRLVAEAFIAVPSTDRTEVNHIDGDKANNRVSNLEWVTVSGNKLHGFRTGLLGGEKHGMAKLTAADVVAIRASSDSMRKTAESYGVTPSLIHAIRNRKIWKYV